MARLPAKVHQKHGRFYYVSRQHGRLVWTALSRVDEGDAALHQALADLHRPGAATVTELLHSYLIHGTGELKAATLADYRKRATPILKVFGHMAPGAVTSSHVAQYLERRKKAGHGPSGNREMAVLSSAMNFGMRQGIVEGNPCRGVRRNREKPRTRYVRDAEFREAFDRAPEALQDLLAVALLTGLRQRDLRELRRHQLTREGILLEESKTGKRRLIEWSDALRFFVTRATSRAPGAEHVLTNTRGQPWGLWAIQSAMTRLGVDWRFHDLRAKAESDHATGLGLLPLYKRARRSKPVR